MVPDPHQLLLHRVDAEHQAREATEQGRRPAQNRQYDTLSLKLPQEYKGLLANKAQCFYANGQVLGRKMFGLKGSILPDREPGLANGGTYWYLTDPIGSVTDLVDHQGSVAKQYRYDAFGGLFTNAVSPYNTTGLTGKAYDAKTGLMDYGARWYDPQVGRFTQHDPLYGNPSEPVTQHRYLYTSNNPVNYTDPTGMATCTEPTTDWLGIITTWSCTDRVVTGTEPGQGGYWEVGEVITTSYTVARIKQYDGTWFENPTSSSSSSPFRTWVSSPTPNPDPNPDPPNPDPNPDPPDPIPDPPDPRIEQERKRREAEQIMAEAGGEAPASTAYGYTNGYETTETEGTEWNSASYTPETYASYDPDQGSRSSWLSRTGSAVWGAVDKAYGISEAVSACSGGLNWNCAKSGGLTLLKVAATVVAIANAPAILSYAAANAVPMLTSTAARWAVGGAALKTATYVYTNEYSNTREWWYDFGKAAATGAVTGASLYVDPAGALVGAGLGYVNAAVHGELPSTMESGLDAYRYLDGITGFNTGIGLMGGIGLQNWDQAAIGLGAQALSQGVTWWKSLNTAQKTVAGVVGLTALSGMTVTPRQDEDFPRASSTDLLPPTPESSSFADTAGWESAY